MTLPKVGDTVRAGEACGDIESVKSVSDLIAPVTGTVRRRNDDLAGAPQTRQHRPVQPGLDVRRRDRPRDRRIGSSQPCWTRRLPRAGRRRWTTSCRSSRCTSRDVDKAAAFYTEQVGFTLDVDYHPAPDFRVVQLTPPGSACSVQLGVGLSDAPAGSARATCLAVTDIEAARRELAGRGVAGQRRPAQVTGRRLAGRLRRTRRPAPPRLRQLRRFRRPGRQHLGASRRSATARRPPGTSRDYCLAGL